MLPVILLFLFIGFMLQLIPAEWAMISTFAILVYSLIIKKKKIHSAATKSQLTQLQNQLLSLILLRLELNQQHQNEQITAAVYHQTISEIDQLSAQLIKQQTVISKATQRSLLESAWLQLNKQLGGRLGIPPWRVLKTPQPHEFTTEQRQSETKIERPKSTPPKIPPPQPIPPIAKVPTTETITPSPTKKSFLKKLLPSRALLFEWLVPFLWQNFGWFIGGFCFIAGSIFLVTYTSGFAKTFAVVLLLTLYVLMLLGSGYYVRRYRPQLKTISDVLLILGILLIPLDFAATVRLIDSGFATTPGLLGIALLVTLMIAIGFTWAAQLASALIDRNLQGEHPWLFISLASLQYAIPLFNVLPPWPLIAGLHLTALLILSYAFWRLTHQWLQALFVERNKSAYYAVGTLVYSASLSFIHLSWAVDIEWPAGYAGPFVMMLTLLLLYVDGQLKHWRRQYVWLSYFTFVLYALSVIALLLAWHGQPSLLPPWFSAATLTLILGVIFYALMIKHYLSLPPLYGLLLCVSGLYGLALLQHLPYPSYFLFSLPGFAALALGYRWAQKHHAVASMLHQTLLLGALSVFIFSLAHAKPGITALITNLVALLIIHFYKSTHYNICFAKLLKKSVVSKWVEDYTESVLIILTLAYCPVIAWYEQFSFALAALALFWGYWGIKRSQSSRVIFLNSSLWALMLSLMFLGYSSPQLLPGLLLFHASLFLGLSLHLRLQSFFYLLLLSLAAAGLLLKIYYFPSASGGKTVIFLALATWMLLWWLYYRITSKPHISLPQHDANQLTLLGFWKVSPGQHSLETVIKAPLENSFYLLWLLGLTTLFHNTVLILSYQSLTFNVHWAIAASGNALITVLVAGYSRQAALLFLAVLLWIAALVVWQPIELNLFISVSALATWLLSLVILRYRRLWVSLLGWQGGYSPSGGRKQAEFSIHLAALSLIVLNLIITITSSATQWPLLLISILFFAWSGYRYRNSLYSYGVIICFSLIISSSYRFNLETLFEPSAALLLALLTLGFATLAHGLSRWQTSLATLYQRPLWHTALFCFVLAVIGAALNYDSGLAWSAFILMLAQFPLLRPWAQAALFRGITVALLLTVTVLSGCTTTETLSCLPGWSFILWIMAYYGLPQWNQRWPQWAVQPEFWPGLGLALITVYFANSIFLEGIYQWQTFGLMTLYLFLLGLRQNWAGILAWLVTLGLTLTGVIAAVNTFSNSLNLPLMIIALFWFNVLIYLSSLLNHGLWKPLKQPLLFWSWLGLHLYLGLITLITIMGLLQLDIIKAIPGGIVLSLALLLSVTYLLHFKSLSSTLGTHGLILVLFNVFFWLFKDVLTPPLLITLWSGGLLGYQVIQVAQQRFERQEIFSLWLMLSFALALAEWLFTPTLAYEQVLISIFLAVISLSFAWISRYGKLGLAVGTLLLASSIHFIWRLILPQMELMVSLSLYGFQAGALAWLMLWLQSRLSAVQHHSSATQLGVWNQQRHQDILWLLNQLIPLLILVTVMMGLAYHGLMLIALVDHAHHIATHPVVHLSVLASGIIWIRLWWHYAPEAESFIYGLGVIITLLLLYLRTLLLGSLAPTLGDTALLMASAYILWVLQNVIHSQALYRFSLLLPIVALGTLSGGESVSATLVLWAAALLYFALWRTTSKKIPLYLSVLAANLGIYLWLPQWAASYNLLHLYTVPAALTVLLMLQLHQRELKPKIVYHVRLVALSTLYSSATLDVFLQQGQLSVFALVLALSLGGIVLGIGLRNRAFLYSGSLFLVLNVLGQLLRFYPEDRLGKAIILMILGGIIIGGMIGFSLQRQALIRRWQLLRTDLATWH